MLNRRILLKGIGGALSLPLLESLAVSNSRPVRKTRVPNRRDDRSRDRQSFVPKAMTG